MVMRMGIAFTTLSGISTHTHKRRKRRSTPSHHRHCLYEWQTEHMFCVGGSFVFFHLQFKWNSHIRRYDDDDDDIQRFDRHKLKHTHSRTCSVRHDMRTENPCGYTNIYSIAEKGKARENQPHYQLIKANTFHVSHTHALNVRKNENGRRRRFRLRRQRWQRRPSSPYHITVSDGDGKGEDDFQYGLTSKKNIWMRVCVYI